MILIEVQIAQRRQSAECILVNCRNLILVEEDGVKLIQASECIRRHFFDVIKAEIAERGIFVCVVKISFVRE